MVEVQPDSFERAEGWETLTTLDVYTCLVVALRVRGPGTGYMGHFAADAEERPLKRLAEMADAAQAEAGSRSITAWPAGLAPLYDDAETAALRGDVTSTLEERGFRMGRALWTPDNNYCINRATLRLPSAHFTAPFIHISRWKG